MCFGMVSICVAIMCNAWYLSFSEIKNVKENRTHQCFDGGLIHHILNVTKNAYNIATIYRDKIDMDLILFGAILHDIGKIPLKYFYKHFLNIYYLFYPQNQAIL